MTCTCDDDDPCFCFPERDDTEGRKIRMSSTYIEQVREIGGNHRWPLRKVGDDD